MIHPRDFVQSMRNAARGVAVTFRHEQSFRLQVLAALVAIGAGLYFKIPSSHFLILLMMVAAVLSLEIVNSVFERIIDGFKPRIHPMVRDAKDLMAGAVLIVSVVSVLVGLVIFLPHLEQLVAAGF
jgi:diacylglycerol kinase